MNRNILRYIVTLPIGCATALIFFIIAVITLMPSKDLPSVTIPHIDKVVHALMFGALSCVMIFDAARYRHAISPRLFITCALLSSVIGGLIELAQGAMSFGRGAEWADFAADILGAFILPLLFIKLLHALVQHYTLSLSLIHDGSRIPHSMEQLYLSAFSPDERRPWGHILRLASSSPDFRFTLIRSSGKAAGFITWWRLSQAIYIEHFAILPSLRSHGLGAMALRQFCAEQGKSPIILEVEPAGSGPIAERRIRFYERCGLSAHPFFPYIQPPYAPGLSPVPLMLMTTGCIPSLTDIATEIHRTVYGL